MDRTEKLRVTQEQQEQLSVSPCELHSPVVTCTVTRWLKELMGQALTLLFYFYSSYTTDEFQSRVCATLNIATLHLFELAK